MSAERARLGGLYGHLAHYLVFAVTSLHAGVGRTVAEAVELPAQKDHLGLPVIWSSSIKGCMRSSFRRKAGEKMIDIEKAIFGWEIGKPEDYSSSISMLDAQLLAIPMRSLRGVFVIATTPLLLERVKTIFALVKEANKIKLIDEILKLGAPIVASPDVLIEDNLVINETPVKAEVKEQLKELIKKLLPAEFPIREIIAQHFAVLDDDMGIEMMKRSLIPVTRIALDYNKKTVRTGALWTEEYVPEMTILHTAIIYDKSRMPIERVADEALKEEVKKLKEDASKVLVTLRKNLGADDRGDFYLVLGGHETIGKGIVKFCAW